MIIFGIAVAFFFNHNALARAKKYSVKRDNNKERNEDIVSTDVMGKGLNLKVQ